MKYQKLLSPIRIGDQVLKGRLVYPNASPHFFQGPETYPAEGYRAYHANLAKNGAAIVTVAEWDDYPNQRNFPADMDMSHMQAFDLSNPAVHNYISQLCEEVHFYGSKMLLSIVFKYPEGYTLQGGPGFGPGAPRDSKPLPKEMMPEVIDGLVEKIKFYKLLGFDGISVRVDGDLCPKDTERSDEYGGSAVNRGRFSGEVFRAVKERLGKNFIIEAVLAWEQPDGYGPVTKALGGYFEEDSLAYLNEFQDAIDIVQIRENSAATSHPTGFNMKQGVHPTVAFAEKVKKSGIDILTEPIGGFQEPDEMERYLEEGKCDMFGTARAFIADPEYGRKMKNGCSEDIVPCLKCNKCHGELLPEHTPWLSICSVNPEQSLGAKKKRLLDGAASGKKKNVAVIGGGCAGMRAAIYAAEQGHTVTIYEKSDRLGGQLIHGDYYSFKWPIGNYKNWLVDQVEKNASITVKMNCEPTPDEIRTAGFDAVLAATGAKQSLPKSIKGIANPDGSKKDGIYTIFDCFGTEGEMGKHVVICGGSESAVETAMYLCENGHDVTILTRQKEICHDGSKLHWITCAFIKRTPDGKAFESPAWEMYDNLSYVTEVTTKEVKDGRVIYVDVAGNEQEIAADTVVICGGSKPCIDEAWSYADCAEEFYVIGDADGAGNVQRCTWDAYTKAMML